MSLIRKASIALSIACVSLVFVVQMFTGNRGISQEDYKILNSFFHKLICRDDFGYVLFGEKPIAFTGYFDPLPSENLEWSRENEVVKKGWDVWRKYYSKESIGEYFFFEEMDQSDPSIHHLVMINKRAFLRTVQEHLPLFQSTLKSQTSPEEILSRIVENRSVYNALNKQEGLVGLVLGYGRINAFLYQRRYELNMCKTEHCFSIKQQCPSKGFKTVEEEREFIAKQLKPINENNEVLYPIFLPQFLGINHSFETQELLARYRMERAKMMRIFSQKKPLDAVIAELGEKKMLLLHDG